MRIWDINPGYLNRQSLLGEHRELHGIVSILALNKTGYSRHPETLRWKGYGWALTARHALLAAEMELRGYHDRSAVAMSGKKGCWPLTYIDEPRRQFTLLAEKYREKENGRIILPRTAQQLWSQHKYSVLARDVACYQELGRVVAKMAPADDFSALARLLTEKLRSAPSGGGVKNAIEHMWGHVAGHYTGESGPVAHWSVYELFVNTQQLAVAIKEPYLLASTALGELKVWL